MSGVSPRMVGSLGRLLGGVAALLLIIGMSAQAKPNAPVPAMMDSTSTDSARYVLRIERRTVAPTNVLDTLDVTIESYGNPYAACMLKIGTYSRAVDIIAVLKGEVVDSCGWEYFRADRVDTKGRPNAPAVLWSAMALAKFTPDTVRPTCLGMARKASIVRLVVAGAPNVPIADSTASIFFRWEDCRDNTLSDATGGLLYVSSQVYDYFESDHPEKSETFPTRLGTPNQCINPGFPNHPRRRIEFHNGGLRFESKLPPLKDSVPSPSKTK